MLSTFSTYNFTQVYYLSFRIYSIYSMQAVYLSMNNTFILTTYKNLNVHCIIAIFPVQSCKEFLTKIIQKIGEENQFSATSLTFYFLPGVQFRQSFMVI
jgi:hypothetical protein